MLIHGDPGASWSASCQGSSLLYVLEPESLFDCIVRLGVLQFTRVKLGAVKIVLHVETCLFVTWIESSCLDSMTPTLLKLVLVRDDLLLNLLALHIRRRRKLARTTHQASLLYHSDAPFDFFARIGNR